MNKKIKTLLSAVILVVLIGGAYLAYSYLSKNYNNDLEQPLTSLQSDSTQQGGSSQQGDSTQPSGSTQQSDSTQQSGSTQQSDSTQQSGSSQQGDSTQQSDSTQAEEDSRVKAVDFTMLDAQGNEVKLSDYYGKPIVVNFWASWCPPCKAELPDFQKVYDEMKDNINFLMIDLPDGQRETIEKAAQFIADEKYTFPVFYDNTQDAAYIYQIDSIPTTLFIDKDGYIVAGHKGQISEKNLRKGISMSGEAG